MHLLLIRHGETEHNVANLLAGVTNSRLTNHGYLQAERLGQALAETRGLRFTHIFASTLQRAWLTADSVQKHQSRVSRDDSDSMHKADDLDSVHKAPQVVQSGLLIEHDFGSYELVTKWSKLSALPESDTPGFKPRETAEAMGQRADQFVEDFLLPLVVSETDEKEAVVAVVSHGLFMKHLWKSLCLRFRPGSVSFAPAAAADAAVPPPSVVDIARWSNTAYLESTIRRPRPSAGGAQVVEAELDYPDGPANARPLHRHHLTVLAINRSDHLDDLERDGVGSSPYDSKQQSIKAFFHETQQI
ncbi:hypothetical protein DV735_g464, partial [Chaetothyriales sp. CBS 134920]